MHIRCITNKYNLQIVIDVCEDTDFARVTAPSLNWIDINGRAKPGDYYHDNRIISLDSPDYSIIESIIYEHEKEEARKREEEGKRTNEQMKKELEELAKQAAEEESKQLEATGEPPAPLILRPPANLDALRAEAKSHPKPKSVNYFDDPQPSEFTQQDLDTWDHRTVELDRLISAVEKAIWDDHAVMFNPPHHIAPGTEFESIREFDVVPHDSKEEYLTYLRANSENIKKYRDYVKTQVKK